MKAIIMASVVAAALLAGGTATEVRAQTDFYEGKNVALVIGYPPAGPYDVYGRALARHLGDHIPGNPHIVPQNMPGAGSINAANWLYNVAPRDGSVIAMFASSAAFEPAFGNKAAQFDALKFTWIGNMDETVSTCGVWHTSGVETFDDLMRTEVLFGASGPAAITTQFAYALKNMLGAKIKVVQGYPALTEAALAMQRGEVQGVCGFTISTIKTQWAEDVKAGRLRIIVQLSTEKHPDLPTVAHIYDYAKTAEDRQVMDLVFGRHKIGRPVAAAPGLPEDRTRMLRKAFMETMSDPAFLADAKKLELTITPTAGDQVNELFEKLLAYPKPSIERAERVIRE